MIAVLIVVGWPWAAGWGGLPSAFRLAAAASPRPGPLATLAPLAPLAPAPDLPAGQAGPPRSPAPVEPIIHDAQIAQAVRRGLDWLYRLQKPDGAWTTPYDRQQPGGGTALVLLAALSAGEDARNPPLAAAMKNLDALAPLTVYVRAVRAMVYCRLSAEEYAARLAEDAAWLVKYQDRSGGWGYGPGYTATRDNPEYTDLSNTFLAMLALREAEEAGAEVPSAVWARCRLYWSKAANPDGGMGYQPPGASGFRLRGSSYGSMTAAGTTALFILSDKSAAQNEPAFNSVPAPRQPSPAPHQADIDRALKWLAANYALRVNPKWVWGEDEAYEDYYLWCLQHVADEGGLGRIGPEDLARQTAAIVLSRQNADGSWGDARPKTSAGADASGQAAIRAALAILTLLKARGAVVIQKLRLPGLPDGDGRDAANLARWLGRTFRCSATWRSIAPDTPDEMIAQSPLLYMQAGPGALPDLPAGQAGALGAKVRAYLGSGGTLLVQPFGGDPAALAAAKSSFAAMLPKYAAGDLPDNHPVYGVHHKLPAGDRPRLFGMSDSCRTRVFILASDVSGAWHQDRWRTHPQAFQLGANLLMYATDLGGPVGRFAAALPVPASPKPLRQIAVARVKHAGDWGICPRAMERLSAVLAQALSIAVREADAVDPARPIPAGADLLWLTGAKELKLDAAAQANLKRYLADGGMLFIDSAIGSPIFAVDAAEVLRAMSSPGGPEPVPLDSPLLTGAFAGGIGADVTRVSYSRTVAAEQPNLAQPQLACVKIGGRIAVVFSPFSVTCPLEGYPVYGCRGLSTPDARRLAANIALYAAAQRGGAN